MKKIIAACGNDCAACPRHLPKSEDELRRTAELWQKIGYRDRVVSNEEIACSGCKPGNWCRFGIVGCVAERGIPNCGACGEFPCARFADCLRVTESFAPACAAACGAGEREVLERAFFRKRENLEEQARLGMHVPFSWMRTVFASGLECIDETTFYFANEEPGDWHILGYLPKGPVPDEPYWAGYCDLPDGFGTVTAEELFDAPYYDGKSLKERWDEVIVYEIGYVPVPEFIWRYREEFPYPAGDL